MSWTEMRRRKTVRGVIERLEVLVSNMQSKDTRMFEVECLMSTASLTGLRNFLSRWDIAVWPNSQGQNL